MPPEARAVHHLSDRDLAGARLWPEVVEELQAFPPADIIIAHNAAFERQWLNDVWPGVPWICTFKSALRVWIDAPKFSNQCLRYWLNLEIANDPDRPIHRAAFDTEVTAGILKRLMNEASIEDMIQWESEPALWPGPNFGKYYRVLWRDIPSSYLFWAIGSGLENDAKWCAWHELHKRGEI